MGKMKFVDEKTNKMLEGELLSMAKQKNMDVSETRQMDGKNYFAYYAVKLGSNEFHLGIYHWLWDGHFILSCSPDILKIGMCGNFATATDAYQALMDMIKSKKLTVVGK